MKISLKKMIRKITIFVLGLFALAIFLLLNLRLLRHTLAEKSGQQPVAGLTSAVEVWRNPEGIPSLQAQSASDVFQALGFVHAQDRLWQMELLRRAALGKLTEILGVKYLTTDQFILQWQFAQPPADSLSTASRRLLGAYCAGINAFLQSHTHRLPLEFSELKLKPEAWQPTHCLAIWRLFGWMNAELDREIFRWKLQPLPNRYRSLFETEARHSNTTAEIRAILNNFADEFQWQREQLEQLTGFRLRSDFLQPPASDYALVFKPRARLTIPTLFYLQNLKTPEFNVWGAAIPGIPFVFAGTTGRIAWITQTSGGTQLDFELQANRQLIEKHCLIPTGSDTLVYSFIYTPARFYLGTMYDSLAHQAVCISINWTGFRKNDAFAALPLLFQSGEIDSLPKLFRQFDTPRARLIVADSVHRFAFQIGPGPENHHPQRSGLAVNLKSARDAHFSGSRDSLNPVLISRILADTENSASLPFAALLRNYLKNWNLATDSASVAATVFNLVANNLVENIFRDEMGDTLFAQFLELPEEVIPALAQILAAPDSPWIDRTHTPDTLETLSEIVKLSFEQAVDSLSHHPLPAAAWGNRTAFQIRHPLNARVGWLNPDLIDWRGSGFPENFMQRTGFDPTKFLGQPVVLQFKLKRPVGFSWNLSTGQSGHPLSENYRDQTQNWQSGAPQLLIPAKEKTRVRRRLILEP